MCTAKRRTRFSVAAALIGVLAVVSSARAENYAFLVAVGDYDAKHLKPLAYTRNDIIEFRQALLLAGFDDQRIVVMHDDVSKLKGIRFIPNAEQIRKEFALLVSSLDESDTLIVGFAGHGVQFQGEPKSYFCPADADLDDPDRKRLIPLSEIYDQLEKCAARQKLLLVDACRNDPQSQLSRSRDTVNLATVTRPQSEPVPEGILALFSCTAGQQSFEFPQLKHGIFFHHVLRAFDGGADGDRDEKLTLDELVTYTRKQTQDFARVNLAAAQTPELKGTIAGTWVLRKLQLAKEFTNSIGMQLKLIPAGEFIMGAEQTPEEVARLANASAKFEIATVDRFRSERPQHRVRISRALYFGVHEVTQDQYRRIMGSNPSYFAASGDGRDKVAGLDTSNLPVDQATWNDAVAFCEKLSEAEGQRYRLPTEAEWEYACRADTTKPFHTGSQLTLQDANFSIPLTGGGPISEWTKKVGSYRANPFGLYDMHGNVAEWCQDWYSEDYYKSSPKVDPQGPLSGQYRVQRGGAWMQTDWTARSAHRGFGDPVQKLHVAGFRVVMEPVGPRR